MTLPTKLVDIYTTLTTSVSQVSTISEVKGVSDVRNLERRFLDQFIECLVKRVVIESLSSIVIAKIKREVKLIFRKLIEDGKDSHLESYSGFEFKHLIRSVS
ncbi:hypothetical protein RND81_08G224100 [Saponaria officinalis]|uniref:Uncharacterized protein n=1 Tax=Saponaria officinalis TaxID=3572 RepID=A0AAW1JB23_SAPOF